MEWKEPAMVGFCLSVAIALSAGSSCPSFTEFLMEPALPKLLERPTDSALQQVLDLTNAERSKLGLEPLRLSSSLFDAAQWMAADMAKFNYFDHLDREGRRVDARAYAFGYRAWRYIGENIAAGQESPAEAIAQWMSSPSHRRNMLRPEFTEIGVGFAENPDSVYGKYWVQIFGTRPTYVANRTR